MPKVIFCNQLHLYNKMFGCAKWIFCILLLLSVVSCVEKRQTGPAGIEKPNIILIVIDDLGYADLSFLPHAAEDVHTPNIDRIAQNGVFFPIAYSTAPICSPARAGLITGQYQQKWGNYWYSEGGLPDSILTLPQFLKQQGYITKKIGKTHLNGGPVEHPLDHGFDSFLGFIDHTWDYLRLSQKDVDAYGAQNADQAHIGPLIRDRQKESYEDDFTTDIFSREAVDFIKSNNDKPFYLHLSYNAVHIPTYQGHPDYLDRFGLEQFPFWDPARESYGEWHGKWGLLGKIDPEGRTRYLLQLTVLDDGIGTILDALEQTGQDVNTYIIFVSDNGGTVNTYSNNSPLNGFKYMFGEGGIRVPMIISGPETIADQQVSSLVSTMDIFPTIVDIVGEDELNSFDGRSLLPLLEGNTQYEPHDNLVWSNGRDSWVVRDGVWKLVHNIEYHQPDFKMVNGRAERAKYYAYPGGIRLYNLDEDIEEEEDLSELYPEKVQELTSVYTEWQSGMSRPRERDGTLKREPEKGEPLEWRLKDLAENAYSNTSNINNYANLTIDGYAGTYWQSESGYRSIDFPHYITIKLNNTESIKGFRYLANQNSNNGRIKQYNFYVSSDGKDWLKMSSGIWDEDANPKEVQLSRAVEARYIRLETVSTHGGRNVVSITEIDIII